MRPTIREHPKLSDYDFALAMDWGMALDRHDEIKAIIEDVNAPELTRFMAMVICQHLGRTRKAPGEQTA